MNNPISAATRRPGDPAPVSLAYPSSHPGTNASLFPGAAVRSPGAAVRERRDEGVVKPDWLGEWENEWGEAEDWGAEIGHTLKLAVLAPITTWGILGQAIMGAGDPIDWKPLEEDDEARRRERDVYRRQRAAQVKVPIFYRQRLVFGLADFPYYLVQRVQEREAERRKEEEATRCERPRDEPSAEAGPQAPAAPGGGVTGGRDEDGPHASAGMDHTLDGRLGFPGSCSQLDDVG